METVERDLTDFDQAVMALFDLCRDIMKAHSERNLNLSNKKNPITIRLNSYIKVYNGMDPEDHVVYFENVFNTNRRMIMLGPQRDGWLRNGEVTIIFGEDCGKSFKNIKFHLSAIYSNACKVRDEVEDEIDGLPGITKPETSYPKHFLLNMYKIFHGIVESDTDKEKLQKHIDALTGDVGSKPTSSADPLSGILDMAEQFTGQKFPRDKLPGGGDISKMMKQVVENPQTKSMIGNMMEGMKNADGLGGIVNQLMGGLGGAGGETEGDGEMEEAPLEIGDVNDEFDD